MLNTSHGPLAPEFSDFLQITANEFLSQPESRAPDFVCAGQSGIASIYVVDARAATMTFFRQIMENEPERFAAMNRIFTMLKAACREPAGQSRDLVGSYI